MSRTPIDYQSICADGKLGDDVFSFTDHSSNVNRLYKTAGIWRLKHFPEFTTPGSGLRNTDKNWR